MACLNCAICFEYMPATWRCQGSRSSAAARVIDRPRCILGWMAGLSTLVSWRQGLLYRTSHSGREYDFNSSERQNHSVQGQEIGEVLDEERILKDCWSVTSEPQQDDADDEIGSPRYMASREAQTSIYTHSQQILQPRDNGAFCQSSNICMTSATKPTICSYGTAKDDQGKSLSVTEAMHCEQVLG